ncbi:MAG: flagellar hook-length control protein FliK, partial [Pseudohongiella sp.]|nr:flagellar hook-length control protein FliK [Pseudohongiella sp.]
MKLVQDSPQNKAAAVLLGAGFQTPGETAGTQKKLAFAEDLRQQISEAVAGSRIRQPSTPPNQAEASASNPVVIAGKQSTALTTSTSKAGDSFSEKEADNLAAGGIFLPQPDQSLPMTPVESDSNTGYSDAWSAELGTADLAIDLSTMPSLLDAVTSTINPDTSHFGAGDSSVLSGSPASQLLPAAWMSLQDDTAASHMPGLNRITDTGLSALAASPLADPFDISASELNMPDYANNSLLNAAFVSEQLSATAAEANAAAAVLIGGTAVADIALPGSPHTAQNENLADETTALNLTAAYDLSLPDVMPASPFDPVTISTAEAADLALATHTETALSSGQTATVAPSLTGLMATQTDNIVVDEVESQVAAMPFAPLSRNAFATQQGNPVNNLSEVDAELQTKGLEPASGASTRSAYVNSLLTNSLETAAEVSTTTEATNTTLVQNNALLPENLSTSLEDFLGQINGLNPSKSTLSDQQLLASVGANASDSASGLQSAALYTADQRLQQAAEARLAHLQGLQQTNASVENATSRMTGTGLSGLDVTFGQPGWVERVGRQMLLQSAQGNSSAQIQLDPPELGSLTIRIQLVDQSATVNFVSPHAMVRDALEQQAQRLQEMFNEQGLNLRDVSVSDQSANARQQSEQQSREQSGAAGETADSHEQEVVSSAH